jgi:hypothetical protein
MIDGECHGLLAFNNFRLYRVFILVCMRVMCIIVDGNNVFPSSFFRKRNSEYFCWYSYKATLMDVTFEIYIYIHTHTHTHT